MTKDDLRKRLRAARREHVAALPDSVRTLVFMRPPAPLLDMVPQGATIGLYRAASTEAPAGAYARYFYDAGHELALPRFADRNAPMQFARFTDPFEESDLETGPFGLLQPAMDAAIIEPSVLFVPLVGFTADGARLGQGGGHYDRWLAAHTGVIAIGIGWDCQLVDELPTEPHDIPLAAIVTPTRLYGPFA
ncbi:5-formyltetrahydrofolate cyclo-ligase [Qipengyuania qiaonensis]|uniref:5-formyltetrahydrofolate cyclo-ligase n=1 Tax=Qipengyuania qiaonensis TaxID=2867240 RepID=UPI0031E9BCAD